MEGRDEFNVLESQLDQEKLERYWNYKKVVQEAFDEMYPLVDSYEGWKDAGIKDGVQCYTRVNESGVDTIRGQGIIKATPEDIVSLIGNSSRKKEWDEMLIESRIIEQFSDQFRIVYNSFQAPSPVTNRDFVYVSATQKNEDGSIFLSTKSIEHPAVPENSEFVRGEITYAGFVLEPRPEGTFAIYIVNTNPKGNIPAFIVNTTSIKQCMNVARIRKVLEGK